MRTNKLGYSLRSALLMTLGVVLCAVPVCSYAQAPKPNMDPSRLEVSEELSESLANQMLELSIATRNRDFEQTSKFVPASLKATAFPSEPASTKSELKWIGSHGWTIKPGAQATAGPITREEWLHSWFEFLDHFAEVEDSRFKVKVADFDATADAMMGAAQPTAKVGATGSARVAFFVIGRNAEGQREWTRGVLETRVRYDESQKWQFDEIKIASLDSMIATKDLFDEVSLPAGTRVDSPSFESAGENGFVYHGAAAYDFNNDGFVDLFVCGGDRNYLYLNDGHGKFKDASHETGVDRVDGCVAAVPLDYDNNGAEDVFLSNVGTQMLLRNRLKEDGKLVFEDVSAKAGVAVPAIGFSVAVGDVNGDGLPDVYVTSYNYYGKVVPNSWFQATNGTPNLLFINQGNGTFKEQAREWGVDDRRWSYAAEFLDVNDDGKLDLYVVNDFGEKALYINKGDRFVDEASVRGVLDPGNGMGVSFGDFNNDGLLDLHVTNMSSTAGNRILTRLFPGQSVKQNVLKKLAAGNSLYQNMGGGKFKDVTQDVGGLGASWAWGGGFIDFDNDGWEDIYSPNGFISGKSMKDT